MHPNSVKTAERVKPTDRAPLEKRLRHQAARAANGSSKQVRNVGTVHRGTVHRQPKFLFEASPPVDYVPRTATIVFPSVAAPVPGSTRHFDEQCDDVAALWLVVPKALAFL